jgi:hypothetical protein
MDFSLGAPGAGGTTGAAQGGAGAPTTFGSVNPITAPGGAQQGTGNLGGSATVGNVNNAVNINTLPTAIIGTIADSNIGDHGATAFSTIVTAGNVTCTPNAARSKLGTDGPRGVCINGLAQSWTPIAPTVSADGVGGGAGFRVGAIGAAIDGTRGGTAMIIVTEYY